MYIQPIHTNRLSKAAYFIESNGEAAVIDPHEDMEPFLELASQRGARIMYIFETHFDADSISGHFELARETSADIVVGPGVNVAFEKIEAADQEIFNLGSIQIQAIHTPHVKPGSICFMVLNEQVKADALFTGDILFEELEISDPMSGLQGSDELVCQWYHSLKKLIKLPDELRIYPARRAETNDRDTIEQIMYHTLAEEKLNNLLLKATSLQEFVTHVTENKKSHTTMEEIGIPSLQALSVTEFKSAISNGVYILDTRESTSFTEGFIPSSVNIGLDGRFAEWAGVLIPDVEKLVLVTEKGEEQESYIQLLKVGFNNVIGFLSGGFEAWRAAGESIDLIIDIEADEFKMDLNYDPRMLVVDVRKELEYNGGHVKSAINIPLDRLKDPLVLSQFEEDENIYFYCGGGYRSVIAASLLKRQGIHNLRNVLGGYEQIKQIAGMPLVAAKEVLN